MINNIVIELFKCSACPFYYGINDGVSINTYRHFTEIVDYLKSLDENNIYRFYTFNMNDFYLALEEHFEVKKVQVVKGKLQDFKISDKIHFRSLGALTNVKFKQFNKYSDEKMRKRNFQFGEDTRIVTPYTSFKTSGKSLNHFVNDMEYCLTNEWSLVKKLSDEFNSNIPTTQSQCIKRKLAFMCLGRDRFSKSSYEKQNEYISKYLGKFSKYSGKYLVEQSHLPVKDWEHYCFLKSCFVGGLCSFNSDYLNEVVSDVDSYDVCSMYPSCFLLKYPMRYIGHYKNIYTFDELIKLYSDKEHPKYAFIKVKLINLKAKRKCIPIEAEQTDTSNNCIDLYESDFHKDDYGRVDEAKSLIFYTTMDLLIKYSKFYTWDSTELLEVELYDADFLPREFVLTLLSYFTEKCKNKKNPDSWMETFTKTPVNMIWGFMGGGWYFSDKNEFETVLNNYNQFRGTFEDRTYALQWAIAVTSHARCRLLDIIDLAGDDWLYSDTDSIRAKSSSKLEKSIAEYNSKVLNKLLECPYISEVSDITVKSNYCDVSYTLGMLDFEDHFKLFKVINKKTYLGKKDDDSFKVACSGTADINIPLWRSKLGSDDELFDEFSIGFNHRIPSDCYTSTRYNYYNSHHIIVTDCCGKSYNFDIPAGRSSINSDLPILPISAYKYC